MIVEDINEIEKMCEEFNINESTVKSGVLGNSKFSYNFVDDGSCDADADYDDTGYYLDI